jgi:putative sterol carrier protein
MNSKKEIEDALNIIKNKLNDPKFKHLFENYTKNIQFSFPDINSIYLLKIIKGQIESFKEETINTPDIYITINIKILIDILNKKINTMNAYATGKLKVKGRLTDLLKLQKLL